VIASGLLPNSLEDLNNCAAVQIITKDNPTVDNSGFNDCENYYRLTDEMINEYADIVFGGFENSDHRLAVAERVMSNYYAKDLHLNYKDL
jgi:hypothetical protein